MMTKRSKLWLISLAAIICVSIVASLLSGCTGGTTTVAETTAAVTTAAETTAAETTAAETTVAEETTAAAETTAAETTVAEETTAAETTAAEMNFEGKKLTISGSTTLLEVSQLWAEAFMAKYGGEITVNGGGSGVGIADLINDTNDIANSSRKIKSSELDKAKAAGEDIKEYMVLYDGICIVTSKNIVIPELTLDQLSNIYIGNYSNWKDVGGPDAPIVALGRDSNSGTGEFFLQKVVQLNQTNTNDYGDNVLRLQSNADVTNQVIANSNCIGYIGMGYLQDAGDKVNLVKVKFAKDTPAIAPTKQTVGDKTYPISRDTYNYVNSKKFSEIAKAYIAFILSPEGQQIGEKAGFVAVK
jgi:phosphate transport system substrate-binding protein